MFGLDHHIISDKNSRMSWNHKHMGCLFCSNKEKQDGQKKQNQDLAHSGCPGLRRGLRPSLRRRRGAAQGAKVLPEIVDFLLFYNGFWNHFPGVQQKQVFPREFINT